MDEMALLRELRADQPALTREAGESARARLSAATAEPLAKPRRFRRRRLGLVAARERLMTEVAGPPTAPRRGRRLVLGALVAAAVAAVASLVVPALGPEPLRDYANAAVRIERGNGVWRVEIKDAYADPEEFKRAFAKMGLDIELRIVPVSPLRERRIIQVMMKEGAGSVPEGRRLGFSVNDCPAHRDECPLAMTVRGDVEGLRRQVWLGREARPGERYADSTQGMRREPVPGVRLIGRSVREATALLRGRGLKAAFHIGEYDAGGAGMSYEAEPSWRPDGGREVTDAWPASSDTVMLLVSPRSGDPDGVPVGDPFAD